MSLEQALMDCTIAIQDLCTLLKNKPAKVFPSVEKIKIPTLKKREEVSIQVEENVKSPKVVELEISERPKAVEPEISESPKVVEPENKTLTVKEMVEAFVNLAKKDRSLASTLLRDYGLSNAYEVPEDKRGEFIDQIHILLGKN